MLVFPCHDFPSCFNYCVATYLKSKVEIPLLRIQSIHLGPSPLGPRHFAVKAAHIPFRLQTVKSQIPIASRVPRRASLKKNGVHFSVFCPLLGNDGCSTSVFPPRKVRLDISWKDVALAPCRDTAGVTTPKRTND